MLVQPAAEARKAEGASWIALLTPRPPDATGREACAQAVSLSAMLMLAISPSSDRRRRSKCRSWGDLEQGEVLKMYSNLGRAKEWRKRQ